MLHIEEMPSAVGCSGLLDHENCSLAALGRIGREAGVDCNLDMISPSMK